MASRLRAGFTLLELVIVVSLVGILASVALERFLRYQEIAEKTTMQATVAAMQSGLTLQIAVRIARGGMALLAGLDQENPVDWLAKPPQGYLGALYDPAPSQVPKGSWYFDLKNKTLVYTPERTRFLTPNRATGDAIAFRVIVRVVEKGSSGVGELAELDIRPVEPIRWLPEF